MQPALASGIENSRYQLLTKIASGGMGTVYVGRLRGAAGFQRLVAIKRAHPHLVDQAAFAKVLLEEARLASLIRHPNAVSVVDVEELEGELLLIMDYVDGTSLSKLIQRLDPEEGRPVPPPVAVRIILDVAAGLHACHTATDEEGRALHLVHRDVSPQNVLVGSDGQARLTDFGIAKSLASDDKLTQTGTMKGKSGYMAPEYASTGDIDPRSDIFGLGVVLWEALTGKRLFRGATELETLRLLTETDAPPASESASWLSDGSDDVLAMALARDPDRRFETAEAFAHALEQAARPIDMVARHREVGELVRELFGSKLDARRQAVRVGATLEPGAVTADMIPGPETADMDAAPAPEPSTLEASTLEHHTNKHRRPWMTGVVAAGVALAAAVAVGVAMRQEEPQLTPEPASQSAPPAGTSATPQPTQPPAPVATEIPSALPSSSAQAPPRVRPQPRKTIQPEPPPPRPPPPAPTVSAAPNPFKNGPSSPKSPYGK